MNSVKISVFSLFKNLLTQRTRRFSQSSQKEFSVSYILDFYSAHKSNDFKNTRIENSKSSKFLCL